ARGARWDRRAMALYTRRQLLVLLLLVAAGGGGLAIGHWRRANPDTVEYLEQLDRAPAPPARVVTPSPPPPGRAARATDTRPAHPRAPPRPPPARPPRGPPPAAGTPIATQADDLDADQATDAGSTSR